MPELGRRASLAGLAIGGIGMAAAGEAAGQQRLRWRLASSFPPTLDTIFGTANVFADVLQAATADAFSVEVHEPGALVPALGVLDAVSEGDFEIAHTASYYFTDRDPAFAFASGMPFGLNSRLQNAWLQAGGGNELLDDFYRDYNVVGIPCGNTGTQMGGWFTRELASLDDVQGLRLRIAGLAGAVVRRIGVEALQTPGGEIYDALQSGRIDGAEWIGPYDDEKLGFYRVARFYYYPGWWEPGTTLHLFVNRDAWERLDPAQQTAVRAAAASANGYMQAKYDVQNPAALKRLVGHGVQLKSFPPDVLEAANSAAEALYAELREGSSAFNRIFEHWDAFRGDGYLWWLVNEIAMDAFMVRARAAQP